MERSVPPTTPRPMSFRLCVWMMFMLAVTQDLLGAFWCSVGMGLSLRKNAEQRTEVFLCQIRTEVF